MVIQDNPMMCSFCGRLRSEVAALIGSGSGCCICVDCVYKALGVIEAANMKAVVETDEVVEITHDKG